MAESQSRRIAKALVWLRENFVQPLRVELRLHEARRLMLLEDLDAATAGYQLGYQSPSQFSREYRRLYSLSPRRDVEQLKSALAPDPEVPIKAG